MKSAKPDFLPPVVLLLAVLGAWLRYRLYAGGIDEKGLLIAGQPMQWCLWLCTVFTGAVIGVGMFRRKRFHHPLPLFSAFGHIWGAAGILLTVLLGANTVPTPFSAVWKYTGILAAAAMLYAAFPIARGKHPFFGLYAVISLFFALHLVGHYRVWCSNPQLLDYVFSFLGAVALMVLAYQLAAASLNQGSNRILVFCGLAAAYCCLTAVSGTEYLYLHLGCALWSISSLYGAQKGGW